MKPLLMFSQLFALNTLFNQSFFCSQIYNSLNVDTIVSDLQVASIFLSLFAQPKISWFYSIEIIILVLFGFMIQWIIFNRGHNLREKMEPLLNVIQKAQLSVKGKQVLLEEGVSKLFADQLQTSKKKSIENKHRVIDYYNHVTAFNHIKGKTYPAALTIEFELCTYILSIINQCRQYADARQIKLNISKNFGYISCHINETAMSAALLCLLNKIIETTPQEGQVHITVSHFDKYWHLQITNHPQYTKRNNKQKIEILSSIFISLCGSLRTIKQIIHLHGGKIIIDKRRRTLTILIIVPINCHQNATRQRGTSGTGQKKEKTAYAGQENGNELIKGYPDKHKAPHILLIMANKELNDYLYTTLSTLFRMNTLQEIEQLSLSPQIDTPDAIIIDESINKLHGEKLCTKIELELGISYVPIILLLNNNENHGACIGYEADKLTLRAINISKLKSDIWMLINNHTAQLERIKKRMIKNTSADLFDKVVQTDPTIMFMDRVEKLLEKNLATEGYTVELLSADMGMSRTRFYNKMKEITGKPPMSYMFSYKMNKAKGLLIAQEYNITEIAMLLGYCDAKYFGKKFREYYHVSPTRYIREVMEKTDESAK